MIKLLMNVRILDIYNFLHGKIVKNSSSAHSSNCKPIKSHLFKNRI